ncbi:MAG: succinate dehydrogenase/fumarate reductase iron-sulfur subunit [Bdellovibrionaceae bacterium]|nr:succinate dehydrogenase/fumarate reductase iron-sulfur subunit [Pseudobdellovibrionaceae bacterium]
MNFQLKVWRQKNQKEKGFFQSIPVKGVSKNMSFLEMLDFVNAKLILEKKEPIAFEHDCREGICGSCGFMINGSAHGPKTAMTTCQLYMREFKEESEICIEPFRAKAFPIIKDLIVDRSSFDRIQQEGGFISINTGSATSANSLAVPKAKADEAFANALCIGCGACVASCPNSSASLFTAARISHFSKLPQGQSEKENRVLNMVKQMDKEDFGSCSHTGACSVSCPKEIDLKTIAEMNSEWRKAFLKQEK